MEAQCDVSEWNPSLQFHEKNTTYISTMRARYAFPQYSHSTKFSYEVQDSGTVSFLVIVAVYNGEPNGYFCVCWYV